MLGFQQTAVLGSGSGTNPEPLFAAGCSACFQGALGGVARQEKADISGSTVTVKVDIGRNSDGIRADRRDLGDPPEPRRGHGPGPP